MNSDQAKTIPLQEVLERIGHLPVRQSGNDLYYLSPIREENTASFHVQTELNVWYDHGDAQGGNCLEFACVYLKSKGEDHTIADALRWLKNMSAMPFIFPKNNLIRSIENKWKLLDAKPLKHLALVRYVENRGIPLQIAKKHLLEVDVRNSGSGKRMFALGFRNEDGGYELRNPFIKSCVSPKTITFVRGTNTTPNGIHIFEGFFDYLTFLTIRKGQKQSDDIIILNSTNCLSHALPYIKNYGYKFIYTWMDNDETGEKSSKIFAEFIKSEPGLVQKRMNDVYKPHKDVNAWFMYNLNLSL